MENFCLRCCSKQFLRQLPAVRAQIQAQSRLFTSTARRRIDDAPPPRQGHIDLTSVDQSSPSPADEAAYREAVAKAGEGRDHNEIVSKISYDNVKITAYDPQDSSANRDTPSKSPPGPLLRRTLRGPNTAGPILRRSSLNPGSATFSRSRDSASSPPNRERRPPRTSQGGSVYNTNRRGPYRRNTPDSNREPNEEAFEAEEGEDPETANAFDNHMEKVVFAQANLLTESLTYTPNQPIPSDLEKSWPNTPMSPSGTIASVSQTLGPLANRQPRTHWTPMQLAEMYLAGELVSFHSESEKTETMKFARQLLDERAAAANASARTALLTASDDGDGVDLDTQQHPTISAAPVPAYTSLSLLSPTNPRRATETTNTILGKMVKGHYPALQRQKMPFMNSIVQQLRNNETYSPTDEGKFMARIQKLVDEMQRGSGGGGGGGAGGQQQKRVESA